jgi:hypothetical protein
MIDAIFVGPVIVDEAVASGPRPARKPSGTSDQGHSED